MGNSVLAYWGRDVRLVRAELHGLLGIPDQFPPASWLVRIVITIDGIEAVAGYEFLNEAAARDLLVIAEQAPMTLALMAADLVRNEAGPPPGGGQDG